MAEVSISSKNNSWTNLQTLLRFGPKVLSHLDKDAPLLVDLMDESQRLWKAMVDAFDGMIYICSIDYRMEFLNDRMIDHFGYDATGELCYNAFGRQSACPWCINHRIIRGETLRWEVISSQDGRWYDVVNAPFVHKDGRVSKFAMMVDINDRKEDAQELKKHRDNLEEIVLTRTAELTEINDQLRMEVEERKHAEKALRLSEVKYRELVENAASLIIRFDAEGRLTFFNEYAQHFFGYSQDEVIGHCIAETILPVSQNTEADPSVCLKNFFSYIENNETQEIENVRRNGERVWVVWKNRPYYDESGKIVEHLCVGMDVTEKKHNRKRIQTLTQALLKAQENERARISRDLHDHIAQDLSSLKIRLQTMFNGQSHFNDQIPDYPAPEIVVDDLINILQRSITEVRNLAYDLRPPELDQLGLVRTLFVYCEDFAHNNGLRIDFIAAGLDDLVLEEDIQINLYRLLQEALYNIKKHAHAQGVTIRMVASSPNLILRIIDDGIGFDVAHWRAKIQKEKRMGLQSMVERINLLNGEIDIRSRPNKGTGIFISIPIKEQPDGRENPDNYC